MAKPQRTAEEIALAEGKVYESRYPSAVRQIPDYPEFRWPKPRNFGPGAKRAWDRWLPDLKKSGVITRVDFGMFELLCRMYQAVNDEGDLKHADTFIRLCAKFGLDPFDRPKARCPRPKRAGSDAPPSLKLIQPRKR